MIDFEKVKNALTDLHGKTAIVTGGARGQGAVEAELLATAGASVLLCDVLEEDGVAWRRGSMPMARMSGSVSWT